MYQAWLKTQVEGVGLHNMVERLGREVKHKLGELNIHFQCKCRETIQALRNIA